MPEDEEFQQKNQDVQMMGVLKTTLYNLGLTDEEKTQYAKLVDMFEEGCPDEAQIRDMDQQLEKLAKLREQKSQLETKISYFEAMAMKREEPVVSVKKRIGMIVPAILLFLAGIAAAVVGFAVPDVAKYSMFFIGAGALAVVIGIFLLAMRKALADRDVRRAKELRLQYQEEERKLREPVEEIQKTMDEASGEAERIQQRAQKFLENYHVAYDVRDARSSLYELKNQIHEYERLKTRAAKSEAAREEFDRIRESLLAFGKSTGVDFGEDIAAGLSQLQMKAAEYRLAVKAYEQACRKKEQFEQEHPMEEITSIEKCPYTLDELNEMIRDVDDRIEDVRDAIEQYTHQLEDMQEQLDVRDEKQEQLEICKRDQELEAQTYHTLQLTQEFLQTAKEQFSARYLGPIENGFGKYYELLTGDASGNWMVNANIAVQMKEQGELRETKWLSAGYQDLLGVCMRLALVDAMYPEEKPFLVLDDPFVNLDEEKVRHGNELLQKISGEYQILYFTCHSSRMSEN